MSLFLESLHKRLQDALPDYTLTLHTKRGLYLFPNSISVAKYGDEKLGTPCMQQITHLHLCLSPSATIPTSVCWIQIQS